MKTSVIHINQDDDTSSICDKVSWCKTRRIILFWDAPMEEFRFLDLKIIQRYCQRSGVQIAFAGDSWKLKALAYEAGIPVFRSVGQAEKARWRRKRRFDNHTHNSTSVLLKKSKNSLHDIWIRKAKLENSLDGENQNVGNKSLFLIAGILSILSMLIFLFPSASVKITPLVSSQQIHIDVQAVPDVSEILLTGIIPLYSEEILLEETLEVASTGSISYPDQTARGEVIFTNLSGNMVDIPQGTIVSTSTEPVVRFRTLESVVLQPEINFQAAANIEALVGGESGNVSEGSILIVEMDRGQEVMVFNQQATSGGKSVFLATPTDLDIHNARNLLDAQMQEEAQEKYLLLFSGNQQFIESSISIVENTYENIEPSPGTPADTFFITRRCTHIAWYYLTSDLHQLAERVMDAALPEGFQATDDTLELISKTAPAWNGEYATWEVTYERRISPIINTSSLIGDISGISVDEANAFLHRQTSSIEESVIQIFPSWWQWMPFLPMRIRIELL